MITPVRITTQLLCTLHLRHDYYQSGRLEDLALSPTRQCRQQLRQCGLSAHPTASGIKIVNSYGADNPALSDTTSHLLDFEVRVRNAQFFSVTHPGGFCKELFRYWLRGRFGNAVEESPLRTPRLTYSSSASNAPIDRVEPHDSWLGHDVLAVVRIPVSISDGHHSPDSHTLQFSSGGTFRVLLLDYRSGSHTTLPFDLNPLSGRIENIVPTRLLQADMDTYEQALYQQYEPDNYIWAITGTLAPNTENTADAFDFVYPETGDPIPLSTANAPKAHLHLTDNTTQPSGFIATSIPVSSLKTYHLKYHNPDYKIVTLD